MPGIQDLKNFMFQIRLCLQEIIQLLLVILASKIGIDQVYSDLLPQIKLHN